MKGNINYNQFGLSSESAVKISYVYIIMRYYHFISGIGKNQQKNIICIQNKELISLELHV
jgi:hypothetical protein